MEQEHHIVNLRDVILGHPSRLRFITRFSNCPRIHDESVADHSFYTALYVYFIGTALIANKVKLDLGRALSKALVHDIDECFSGDFIRMFKHSDPALKTEIDKACMKFMVKMCSDISESDKISLRLFGDWHESKMDIEGKLVSFADYLSVLSYIHQEIDLGNHRMERQVPELIKFHATFETDEYLFLDPYVLESAKILDEIESIIQRRAGRELPVGEAV